MRIPSAVPQAYAACAHLSLLLLPRRVSASRVPVSLKMIRFLLVHALLESTFGEVSMDTPGYSYCNALHRTESYDTCCEGGDIWCGRRLSEEPAFKENLTAHGRSLGHCCDYAAFCECLQNYVAPPPSSPYATCEPNRDKCDSSIGGDCCTARATDHEERRCRDGWIPIYIGVLPLLRRCLSCVDAGKGSRLRRAALSTELLPRPCTVPHRNIVLGRQQRLHLLLPDMFGNSCG